MQRPSKKERGGDQARKVRVWSPLALADGKDVPTVILEEKHGCLKG